MDRSVHLLLLTSLAAVGLVASAGARAQSQDGVGVSADNPQVVEPHVERRDINVADIDTENFEAGAYIGTLSIEDFGSSVVYGARLAYHFTEDLFAEANFGTSKAGKTSYDATDIKPWVAGEVERLKYAARDLVRKDMCINFGAFITESSGHLSEYLPYYRKSDAGRKLLRVGYDGGSRFYATNWPTWRRNADKERLGMLRGTVPMQWERSWEYASWIIEAREKDAAFRIHGNVMNHQSGSGQLITNLPADGCVEVACLVDQNGIQPTRYGTLPPQMAALCASNMSMFDLGAQAAIERNVEKAIYALLLDPLSAAVCTPQQIKAMTLELFAAEKPFLPCYK